MLTARRALALSALAFLAACGGNDSTGPGVAEVIVTPETSTTGFLGSTIQFTAQARDRNGNAVAGVQFAWTSSDNTVASVDASGRATALAAGTVQISATTDGATGSAAFTVDPAPCDENVDLAPGEHQVLPANCAIFLPAGTVGDRYRVAVVNQNLPADPDSESARGLVTDVQVEVQGVASAPVANAPLLAPPAVTRQTASRSFAPIQLSPTQQKHLRWAEGLRRETAIQHRRIRQAEWAVVQTLGAESILPDLTAQVQASPARQSSLPQKLQLRPNPPSINSCTATEDDATAILLAQNDLMAVYQDSALNADAGTEVTPGQAQQILDYYASYGKDVIDAYFPGLPDVDGNGKIIVYMSFNDDLSDGGTAAFVWGGDLFPANGFACANSNEADLMYFNAALARALDEGFEQALETTVHEVKHIVSFRHGIARARRGSSEPFHPSWLEEGTAEIAGNLSSRAAWAQIGGPAVNATVVGDDFLETIVNNNDELPPEVLGVVIRLNRATNYLASQPNALMVEPNGATFPISIYGSGWTFLRWMGDVFGQAASAPGADQAFFATQVDSLTTPGTTGLEAISGRSFQELLEEFAVAVMLNGTDVDSPTLGFTSYNFPRAIEIWCFATDRSDTGCSGTGPTGAFPWPVTTVSNDRAWAAFGDGVYSGPIGPTGIRIHEFLSAGEAGGIALRVTAAQPAKIVIARID